VKRLLVVVTAAVAIWGSACSSGSGPIVLPPPTGKYSLASLSGQYAFTSSGEVFAGGGVPTPLARVGSFIADGNGGITGGVEDVNAAGNVTNAISVTGGSYTVSADGRGTLTLNLGPSSINFGIVLTSTSDGLLIDETSTSAQSSTGSGNFTKQSVGSFLVSGIAGPYVFDFSGLDGNGNPESFVGQFQAASGAITTGFFDDNDAFQFLSGAISGSFAQDSLFPSTLASFGRGVALIAGQNFVFYVVDPTRVRFISTNGGMLSGDAVAQSNTIPANTAALNSSFAFIVAGSSANGGLTRVGRFTANGASVTNILMDTNNAGSFGKTNSGSSASISLDPAVPGRGMLTFKADNFQTPLSFVFYLSSASQGVIQETTQSNGVAAAVADGTIAVQSGSPFSAGNITGTYALNWSGLSFQQSNNFIDEEDLLAQTTVSSLALSGAADIFQFTAGAPVSNLAVSGSISINGDGNRSTMGVKLTGASTINFVVYFVNPQLAFLANNSSQSPIRIVAGVLKTQQ
jgi:hypothetical protein